MMMGILVAEKILSDESELRVERCGFFK